MSLFESFFGHLAEYEFTAVPEHSPTQGLTFSLGAQSQFKASPRLKPGDSKSQADVTSRNGFPSPIDLFEDIDIFRSDGSGLSCGDLLVEKAYAGESACGSSVSSSIPRPKDFSRERGPRLCSGRGYGDVNFSGKPVEAECKDSQQTGHQLSEVVRIGHPEFASSFQAGQEIKTETGDVGLQCMDTQPLVEFGQAELSASFQIGEIEATMSHRSIQGDLQQQTVEFGSPKLPSWISSVGERGESKSSSSNQSLLDRLVCPLPESITSPQAKQSVFQSPSPDSITSSQGKCNVFQSQGPSPESIMNALIGIQRDVEKIKAVVPRLCKGGHCNNIGKREVEAAAGAVTFMSQLANAAASILPAVEPQGGVHNLSQGFSSFESPVSNHNIQSCQAFSLLEQQDRNDNLKPCQSLGSIERSESHDSLQTNLEPCQAFGFFEQPTRGSISPTSPLQFCEIGDNNVVKLNKAFPERAPLASCGTPGSSSSSELTSKAVKGGRSPYAAKPEFGSERSAMGRGEQFELDGSAAVPMLSAGVGVNTLGESFDLVYDPFRESCLAGCQAKSEWGDWNSQLGDALVEELTTSLTTSLGNVYNTFASHTMPIVPTDSTRTNLTMSAQAAESMAGMDLAAESADGSHEGNSENSSDTPNSSSPVIGVDDDVAREQEPGEVPRSCYTVMEMEIDDEASREGELDKVVRKSRYKVLEMNDMEILTEQTYFCNICNKGFKREANLKMHMRSHGARYKSSAPLIESYKGPKLQQMEDCIQIRFSCPFKGCNRNAEHPKFQALKTMLCLKNHYKRSHTAKTLQCSVCKSKQFSVVADLKTHEKHCGSDNWLCSCGTTFSRKEKLRSHIGLFDGHYPVNVSMVLDDAGNGKMKSGRDSIARMQRDPAGYLTTPVGVTS